MAPSEIGFCEICHRRLARDKEEWRAGRCAEVCPRLLRWAPSAAYSDCYLAGYERVCRELAATRRWDSERIASAVEGRSLRAAAKVLGVPKSTLWDRLHRGALVEQPRASPRQRIQLTSEDLDRVGRARRGALAPDVGGE